MESAKSYIQKNEQRFIDELISLLKIPSVSANSDQKGDMITMAEAVKIVWKMLDVILLKFVKPQDILLFMEKK